MLAVLIALLTADPSPTPKPRPTPAPVLEGRVQGPDGKPIADALVVARARMAWAEPPLSTKTDAAGAFRLTLKTGGAHHVWVHARGLAVANREDVRPGAPLAIRLESGGSIEGVVRDASGAPVEGAQVETEPNGRVPSWVPGAGVATASTDRNGRFRLTGLGARPHTVVATARGHGRGRQQHVLTGRRVELVLVPGASVTGYVVDAEGRPLADVVVRLEAQERMLGTTPSARATDARGRFAFDGVAAGPYALVARHPELGLAVSPGVDVGADGEICRDVILLPGVDVTGRLVDPDERPVAGRVAVGEIGGEPAPRAVADALSVEASADGRFRLEGVPLGAAALTAPAPGFGARRVDFEARPASSGFDLGDVTMDPGLRIRGRVRSRSGAPISEASLHAYQRYGSGHSSAEGTTSDEAGGFMLGGLQAGLYHVSTWARGFAPLETTAEAGTTDLALVLDPAGSITGIVVDEKGAAVPSFRVSAEKSDFAGSAEDEFTAADGRFVLEDVGEGVFTVSVTAPEYAPAAAANVAVKPGRATDVGRIRLRRGATIRGEVANSDGLPVAGATITAVPSRGIVNWSEGPTASSDASGQFELTDVPPGTTDVSASHPGFAENRIPNVEVDATRAAEIRIVLSRGGRIEGMARRRDGGSLAGTFVLAMSRDRESSFFERPRAPVGPDGSFVLERVPAGATRVTLMLSDGRGRSSSSASREVDVRDGETVTVELVLASILVSGRVTRGDEPVAGARVNLRMMDVGGVHFSSGGAVGTPLPSTGPERGTGLTDEAGFYQLLLDGPGPAWASVAAGSPPVQHPFPDLEVPDAESHTLDFALGAAPLSGVVVDAETNAPLGDASVSASRRDGGRGRSESSQTGPDGRFRLEVEPGEYRLGARRDGYSATEVEVSPGSAGLSEILLALEKGEVISGRLVDARGNGVAGTFVSAAGPGRGNGAVTTADGHFRITGLKAASYTLFGGAAGLGVAVRSAVTAPAESITLQLAPGGRVRVRALGVDGSPAQEAVVRIVDVDGLGIQAFESENTNTEGLAELATPSGVVTLEARGSKGSGATGRVTVDVPEGQTVPAEITLKPAATTSR